LRGPRYFLRGFFLPSLSSIIADAACIERRFSAFGEKSGINFIIKSVCFLVADLLMALLGVLRPAVVNQFPQLMELDSHIKTLSVEQSDG
jgi:galactitol-specific phosphotransferase system IIC component